MGTDAGLLDVDGEVINHSGYYDQDGGIMTTFDFTNDSSYGVNVDNNADFRARNLAHNAGTFAMWRNAIVRGPLAIPPNTFWLCNFTNNATFQMGSVASDGGTFQGILTNYGSFTYYQGDFSSSSLINHGTMNLNNDFTCRRFENNGTYTLPSNRWITADGGSYPEAVENNGNLSMSPSSHIDVGSSKLVNNGPMYAGGPGSQYAHIYGDMENHAYLLPCLSSLAAGQLYINGDFSAFSGATLRIRLTGTAYDSYDHLAVQGTAALAGVLDVRLTGGFVPSLGDSFSIVGYSAHSGQFNPVYLPTLPNGWEWNLSYGTNAVTITVVEPSECHGDLDGDNDVDLADLQILLAHYGQTGTTYDDGDLDEDGDVDLADLQVMLTVYGTNCT